MHFKRQPISETFSFGVDPIWSEVSLPFGNQAGKAYSNELQSLDSFCHKVAGRIPLVSVYGRRIKVSLLELSSSFVVRSEHHYSKDERRRLSLRKHLYEEDSDGIPNFEIPETSFADIRFELEQYLGVRANPDKINQLFERFAEINEWKTSQRFEGWLQPILDELFGPSDAVHILYQILMVYAEPTLRARPFHGKEKWGEYLGFVDLRMFSRSSPVAFALLVPPRCYRNDDAVSIICGNYSPIFGAPGFHSSAYAMHDPEAGGAKCSQAAVINCLTLLSDRGARLSGGYNLTYLGKERETFEGFDPNSTGCYYIPPSEDGVRPSNAIRVAGLMFDEVSRLLTPENCGLNNDAVRLPWKLGCVDLSGKMNDLSSADSSHPFTFNSMRLAMRLIVGYLKARCPIILYVDSYSWYKQLILGFSSITNEENAHAVVLVGYRRAKRSLSDHADPVPGLTDEYGVRIEGHGYYPDVSELIVNDPGFAPFQKLSIERCFEAAQNFDQTENGYPGQLHFHCVTPENVVTNAMDCIQSLCSSNENGHVHDYNQWTNYFGHAVSKSENNDYRIELLHRDDIIPNLLQTTSHPFDIGGGIAAGANEDFTNNFDKLFNRIASLPNSSYWCVAGYRGLRGLSSLWLFDSETKIDPKRPWALAVHWNQLGWLTTEPENSHYSNESKAVANSNLKYNISVDTFEKPLGRSVITSCSQKPLGNLIAELNAVSNVSMIDLYVLRDVDLQDMKAEGFELLGPSKVSPELDADSSAIVLSIERNVETIADWVESRLKSTKDRPLTQIAALATYFPHITARSKQEFEIDGTKLSRRKLAIEAITNTVRLAIELQKRGLMKNAVVEIVAGTILDECNCSRCVGLGRKNKRFIFESDRASKLRAFCDGLLDVVNKVNDDRNWAFAVELEPGTSYVVNSADAIRTLLKIAETEFTPLSKHLGLNLDVAHASIVRRRKTLDFSEFKDYVVHSHICDTPGMHTRDQPLGTWQPLEKARAAEYEDLRLLTEIANTRQVGSSHKPFTSCVALELEGCARMSWVHNSLSRLLYMTELARNLSL